MNKNRNISQNIKFNYTSKRKNSRPVLDIADRVRVEKDKTPLK